LSAYVVKHLVEEQGPLLANLKMIRETPYSYTSKEPEATDAASGSDVYVIEVRREGSLRTFWLGYKYRAKELFKPAGGGLWKNRFKYRNSAVPGDTAIGFYFEALTQIVDAPVCDWLSSLRPGMARMPEHLTASLEAIIADPASGAKRFA
jgi:hypothetical protein